MGVLMRGVWQVRLEFWDAWKTFEVKHGNEDTFRDMLRIKRSVEAAFMTRVRVARRGLILPST